MGTFFDLKIHINSSSFYRKNKKKELFWNLNIKNIKQKKTQVPPIFNLTKKISLFSSRGEFWDEAK